MYTLHGYFRSSATWRVRVGFAAKGLSYTHAGVHLLKGEHRSAEHLARNPLGTIPLLEVQRKDGTVFRLGESLAILQYLEEQHPTPTLFPGDVESRAHVRWMAELINADIHPLQNMGTLQQLEKTFNVDDAGRKAWAQHFIARGFTALEALLKQVSGSHCVGNTLSLADVCLVPQVYNARRFGVDLAPFPTLVRVADALAATPLFQQTHPDRQPDAPPAT